MRAVDSALPSLRSGGFLYLVVRLGCFGQVFKIQSTIRVGCDTCYAAFPFNDYESFIRADIAYTVVVRIPKFYHIDLLVVKK